MVNYVQIDTILKELDIEGLLDIGAPDDEYSSEAKDIELAVSLLGQDLNEDNLLKVITELWVKSFGPFEEEDIEKRKPELAKLASEIISLYKLI